MKCSSCYADNQPWATVCASCGQAVLRLETCPLGHLLPPGEKECPICPSLWPEVGSFAGPPVLRGFLWVVSGRLASASDPGTSLDYLEIRDQESPLALTLQTSGALFLAAEDDSDVNCRILMRPDGVQVCSKNLPGKPAGPPAYEHLPPGHRLDLGGVSLRHLELKPPPWVEKLAGSLD